MPRKGKFYRAFIFKLDKDNPKHQRLMKHLAKLAEDGKASAWIIDTLLASLPAEAARTTAIPNKLPVIREPRYTESEE